MVLMITFYPLLLEEVAKNYNKLGTGNAPYLQMGVDVLLSIVVMGIINGGQYLGTMDHTGGNVRGKT